MSTKTPAARRSAGPKAQDVEAFLASAAHPLEPEIRRLRALLLGLDPSIREEVKWRSVSFRNAHDFFATVDLRSLRTLQVVLYTGVKRKPTAETGVPVEDPHGLIVKWAAKDRCVVVLGAGPAFAANEAALAALVTAWLRYVEPPRALT